MLIKNNLMKSPFQKVRLGRQYDGGYVICPELKYDCILGCGVANDVSFENDLLNQTGKIPCYLFDGTINCLPMKREEFRFIKKNIGSDETDTTTNLSDWLKEYKNIFLKMDIEGGEYDWYNFLINEPENTLDSINQIVLELHDIKTKNERAKKILNLILKNFYIIHIHGNNCCDYAYDEFDECMFFNVFEITFLNKRCFNKFEPSDEEFPTSYDMQNIDNRSELYLYTYPFYERIVKNGENVYKIAPWNNRYNDKFEFNIVKDESKNKRWLVVARYHPWGQDLQVRIENIKTGKIKIIPCGVSTRESTIYLLDNDI